MVGKLSRNIYQESIKMMLLTIEWMNGNRVPKYDVIKMRFFDYFTLGFNFPKKNFTIAVIEKFLLYLKK